MRNIWLTLSFVIFSFFVKAQVYQFGNTGGTSGWYKIGVLSLGQGGRDAFIHIIAGAGYNAALSQNGECSIHFRTSNGSSNDGGFYASGSFYNMGSSKVVTQVIVKQLSTSRWEFYAKLPVYTGVSTLIFECSNGTWTSSFTYSSITPTGKNLAEQFVLNTPGISLTASHKFGIGTASPTQSLTIYTPDGTNNLGIYRAVSGNLTHLFYEDGGDYGAIRLYKSGMPNIQLSAKGASYTYFNAGNVLIGKTSQTNTSYKLDVNGNIRANKVVVNTSGADYVFDSTYHLRPLDSLKNYIKKHHHLPGIPLAEKMQQEGLSVGDAYTKLLEKVEEMTRYIIELNKQNYELKNEIMKIKNDNEN